MEIITSLFELVKDNLIEIAIGLPIVTVLINALRSSAKLINMVVEAVEDDNLDSSETKAIAAQAKKTAGVWKLVWTSIKNIFTKKK